MIERIAELVRNKQIEGITDLRDESDRDGIRVVIELRRDANSDVILKQLFKHSQMENTFGINMLSLVDGQPRTLTLKEMLHYFIEHQKDVVTRRTQFDLDKAEARAHILVGLRRALDFIDAIIALIRSSLNAEEAKKGLIEQFTFSDKQAQAILDMRLARLTGLEREKLEDEEREILGLIAQLRKILGDEAVLLEIIKSEIAEIKKRHGDPRRSEIVEAIGDLGALDLIAEEDVVVTLTHQGYIKRLPLETYRSQRRGGRGITAMGTREEDFVENLFITTTHHYLYFVTNKGKIYRTKVHEIPEASRQARGLALVNLISLEAKEKITAVIPMREASSAEEHLFMATKQGMVKKTLLTEYASMRSNGIIGIALRDGDELIAVRLTNGQQEIVLGTRLGMAIRFDEKDVRPTGRDTQGVRGIDLEQGDYCIGMDIVREGVDILVVTQNGFGKRSAIEEYRKQTRGGKGIRTVKMTERNGQVVSLRAVSSEDDLMVITEQGIIIRMDMRSISQLGRSTQGVTIIRLDQGDSVVAIARVVQKADIQEE